MPQTKHTILIVDDTETNIDILLELLSAYDIVVAIDGESALEIAYEDKPDLILLDIMMPGMDGYEVCKRLKSIEHTKDIPVIFITANTDEDSIERAYEVGGIDYVTKPFKPRELTARVKTQIKLKNLLSDLNFIASYDYLTKVYNRRKFFELAEIIFKNSKEDLYAVMIDIDKFKKINDTYGHPVGDEVIKAVATSINESISKEDLFARIGGEEFAIICHCDSKEEIIEKNEFIRQSVEKLEVSTSNGDVIKFTISNGIAKAGEAICSLDLLLKGADAALYEAKGKGRNRVVFRS
ncbi:response regulator receiver modulated diguanylate cyclase [Sulfurimonas gotlandica GD1]|uniref:diguanylate cyclase n=1 Tax=Sulfurimonas gotlandica (strain DSM 19862 / JCM 16533 / GD1) TaxID=929558 RepID=H1FVF1_SULGG|nr:diguanylate cyclase [Sulfurimonas gotlandica]EHP30264.1 response regulator receiver modulated diguanylate cyclase [Sulfurimonas gotlandica GD1]